MILNCFTKRTSKSFKFCFSNVVRVTTIKHGWNTVQVPEGSKLFEGIENERFYFVHSYGAADFALERETAFEKPKVTWAEYGSRFVAAVENGPLTATQFHPEKSGQAGLRLIANWLETL
ncbi:MAG: hypothetical protein EB057_04055 [Microbacteriaceae bacterium]|nr:hypothetical protein [Microbacteriaceae bacterium]